MLVGALLLLGLYLTSHYSYLLFHLSLIISAGRVMNAHFGPNLEEELQERVGIITRTAFKMSRIVDELLLLAEVRKANVKTAPLDMAAIVRPAHRGKT